MRTASCVNNRVNDTSPSGEDDGTNVWNVFDERD